MSERTREDGNTDAPRVEENEVRTSGAESGTRRVGEVRQDREGERKRGEDELGTSWTSVFFGWLAALGAGLIFSGIVAAVVGGIVALVGLGASSGGISSIVGAAVTLLLAFLIGGYVAGRMASRSGAKHGLLVALLALIVAIFFVIVGGILGATFADALGNAVPPGLTQSIPTSVPQGLGTAAIVGGILALLTPFIGGALGGLGEPRPEGTVRS